MSPITRPITWVDSLKNWTSTWCLYLGGGEGGSNYQNHPIRAIARVNMLEAFCFSVGQSLVSPSARTWNLHLHRQLCHLTTAQSHEVTLLRRNPRSGSRCKVQRRHYSLHSALKSFSFSNEHPVMQICFIASKDWHLHCFDLTLAEKVSEVVSRKVKWKQRPPLARWPSL